MFRIRRIKKRTKYNLKIASLLSFIAGIVNIVGYLSIQKLTTNVTGHFAYFIDEVFHQNYLKSINYILYIFFFFLGSFFSRFIIEYFQSSKLKQVFQIPVFIESLILLAIANWGKYWVGDFPNIIAWALLFAMGLQNSLVTTISNAVVRTTHLTGLFTDLGIEVSRLFFKLKDHIRSSLIVSIKLRITIISFFFIGGIIGGLCYQYFALKTLLIPSILLLMGIFYDVLKFGILRKSQFREKIYQSFPS